MQIQINPGDELPIYRQIIRQVTEAIALGRAAPGDKLDSHRELASKLVIAPLTVKKAYDELERQGYIETRRGRGTFIGDSVPKADRREVKKRLHESARHLVTLAELSGIPFPEVIAMLEKIRSEMES